MTIHATQKFSFCTTTSILFAFVCLLTLSLTVNHAEAQGPISTIYNINDQVEQIENLLTNINIQDVEIYDERLDRIEDLLRTAFIDIGEQFQMVQAKQAELEQKLDNITNNLNDPTIASHWASPYWDKTSFGRTRLSILNPSASTVEVVINFYADDRYGNHPLVGSQTVQIEGTNSKYINCVPDESSNLRGLGWVELVADGPILPHGHIEYDSVGNIEDQDDFYGYDVYGNVHWVMWGLESKTFSMTWYPLE